MKVKEDSKHWHPSCVKLCMKISKRAAKFAVLVSSISLVCTLARADSYPTVTLDAYSGVYPGLGGGEFTAYTSVDYLGNYAASAQYDGGFQTFCIETGVDFTPGNSPWNNNTPYYYTLGTVSQPLSGGGTGSATSLSLGAAFLYYEFATGNLDNLENNIFNYTYGSARQSDDNLLQAAIWAFQGGQSYSGYPNGGAGNPFYNLAVNDLTALGLVASNPNDGTYSVQILQMWTQAPNGQLGTAAQNQLVLTGDTGPTPSPVPDGGTTAILLGGALTGLAALRRKLVC